MTLTTLSARIRMALGRKLSLDEALVIARRATFDPGSFTKRVRFDEHEWETLERWQARAVLVALAAPSTDDRWRYSEDTTDYEQTEISRLQDEGAWLACGAIDVRPDEDAPEETEGSQVDTLARLLDEYEAAVDAVSAAMKRKSDVKRRVSVAAGLKDRYLSDDQLMGALLRALVRARASEREDGGSA